MIRHIDEVDEVKVGQYYWVPHVRVRLEFRSQVPGGDRDGWIACRGELHTDPEIEFFVRHWHYDGRFLPDKALKDGLSHVLSLALNVDRFQEGDRLGAIEDAPPVLRRRKVVRVGGVSSFGIRSAMRLGYNYPTWRANRVPGRDCRRCPHRGGLLQSSEVAGGQLICPLHGLRFDRATGHMVKWGEVE